jgi:hypothetical protein
MAKTKKKRAVSSLEININEAVKVILNLNEYRKQLDDKVDAYIGHHNDNEPMEQWSLTQCADICDVDAPQLNYYVKQGIVKPNAKVEIGCKKYFSIDGLLTFFIVKSLKQSMRINIDCLNTLQKSIRQK